MLHFYNLQQIPSLSPHTPQCLARVYFWNCIYIAHILGYKFAHHSFSLRVSLLHIYIYIQVYGLSKIGAKSIYFPVVTLHVPHTATTYICLQRTIQKKWLCVLSVYLVYVLHTLEKQLKSTKKYRKISHLCNRSIVYVIRRSYTFTME